MLIIFFYQSNDVSNSEDLSRVLIIMDLRLFYTICLAKQPFKCGN